MNIFLFVVDCSHVWFMKLKLLVNWIKAECDLGAEVFDHVAVEKDLTLRNQDWGKTVRA